MRIVVTGGAGLTGGAVCRALLRRGHSVSAMTRRPESVASLDPGVAPIVGDCRDTERLGAALRGADALVHVAGILLGQDIARSAALRELRTVVVVSTAGIYSTHRRSVDAYRRSEAALRDAAPATTFVRPTMIYGSGRDRNVHHVIRWALRWKALPLVGSGAHLLQPIHYADLAEAIAALTQAPRTGVVDAGGGSPLTARAAALAVFAALELPPRFVQVPAWLALGATRAVDAVRGSRWTERLERLDEDRSVDNRTLVSATGVHPREFAAGVADEVASMGLA